MKTVYIILILLTLCSTYKSQSRTPDRIFILKNEFPQLDYLSQKDRDLILEQNRQSINELIARGKINPLLYKSVETADFEFPVKSRDTSDAYGFYAIPNFVDHDPAFPDHLLDYNGGTRTYDWASGYNHQGTDIIPWPFMWYTMEHELMEIISMADGVIIGKEDGNPDRNCDLSHPNWNAVYVKHNNGATVWYGHMKMNSLTEKEVGDSVHTGEYLGLVGSSGKSYSPHLHLEIYNEQNNLIDPWEGPYNNTITESWWKNQKPYYESRINRIATHSAFPEMPECPESEILNLQDEFLPGDTVYLACYYQDLRKDQNTVYKVFKPSGNLFLEWDYSIFEEYYSSAWLGFYIYLPSAPEIGTWKFEATFEGNVYSHEFEVIDPTAIESEQEPDILDFRLSQNYPNPFNPNTIINYTLPVTSDIILSIYNIMGQEIKSIEMFNLSEGTHHFKWDGRNMNDEEVSSGIYIYKLRATGIDGHTFTKSSKMLLQK